VAVTTLSRPERLNAVSGQTFVDLAKVLRRLHGDSRCGTIVLTGAGIIQCGMDFATPLGDGEANA
jgi:enoyl-CoA hydratase/carnithine racemase